MNRITKFATTTAILLALTSSNFAQTKRKFTTGIMGGVARVGFPPESTQGKIFITGIDVVVLDVQGKEVRRTKTNERGYFWLTLAPGTYSVKTDPNHVGEALHKKSEN